MQKYILSLNSGSSSLKFNLFELGEQNKLTSYLSGIVEEIGNTERSLLKYTVDGVKQERNVPVPSHQEALKLLFNELESNNIPMSSICGVGHRVVHGGDKYTLSKKAARFLNIPHSQFNGITVHLGNGCSIAKICSGISVDTSMGFTPLEGLVMGTRAGDLDPALIPHVACRLAKDADFRSGSLSKCIPCTE